MTGKRYKLVTLFVLMLWLMFIFYMSHQPAEESSAISDTVSYRAVAALDQICGWNLKQEQIEARAKKIHYPVRKAAHMTEYAILAILLLLHLSAYRISGKRRYALSAVLAVLYAATDEYHQTFVEGRYGSPADVAIDCAGVFIGLSFVLSASRIAGRHRREHKNRLRSGK